MKRLSPASQPSPVMQVQEDGDNLIPFAKSSRVVSRSSPLSLPSRSLRLTPQHYGDIFWDNLSQRPSSTWMEEQYIPSLLRATGCSQPGVYPPEGLPPPEMLFRRKRRRSYLAGMQGPGGIPARVRAVTYHLEDLRRRQRIINELKKAQWSSCGAAAEPPVPGEASCGFPSTKASEAKSQFLLFPSSSSLQLLWSPWSPLVQEGSFLSRQLSSMTPCSTVRARGNPLSNTWGWSCRGIRKNPYKVSAA
ncbi:hypothetical protein QTO34_009509 [Cnephaeus nilssonii]|uniref:Inhibitor of CDK, cyclin A1 interacting protein 1 n=1 Tax=Cnephaeus nilssonii TaxID=3371016 RepID=A0AA40HHY6_CNENI|nr:hypothetical protein QTO34_009509 [Eptesicus nilssonii]